MRYWRRCFALVGLLAIVVHCGSTDEAQPARGEIQPDPLAMPVAATAGSPHSFSEKSVDVPPRPLKVGEAQWPLVPHSHVEGRVRATFVVRPDSTAHDIRVAVEDGPHWILAPLAIEHVERSRFAPALKDGKAVACSTSIMVRFKGK